jgi:hypothetical protein
VPQLQGHKNAFGRNDESRIHLNFPRCIGGTRLNVLLSVSVLLEDLDTTYVDLRSSCVSLGFSSLLEDGFVDIPRTPRPPSEWRARTVPPT